MYQHPKPMIIGPAPGTGPRLTAFSPVSQSGRRLCELSGLSPDEFVKRFDRVNLLDYCPHELTGEHVPEMRVKAEQMFAAGRMERRRVVLCGRLVAAAMKVRLEFAFFFDVLESSGSWFTIIPHPSGLNRAWNDPTIKDKVSALLKIALTPYEPSQPSHGQVAREEVRSIWR